MPPPLCGLPKQLPGEADKGVQDDDTEQPDKDGRTTSRSERSQGVAPERHLPADYEAIMRVLDMLSPATAAWVEHHSRVREELARSSHTIGRS